MAQTTETIEKLLTSGFKDRYTLWSNFMQQLFSGVMLR